MAKESGFIGYAINKEVKPGVWKDTIVKKPYKGNMIRNNIRNDLQNTVNGSIVLNNQVSFIANPFAISNSTRIRFITLMGSAWNVTNVEVLRPKLLLTIGGAYNGPQT